MSGVQVKTHSFVNKDKRDEIRIQAETSGNGRQRYEVLFRCEETPQENDIVVLALKGGHEGRYRIFEIMETARKDMTFGEIERIDL